MRPLTIGDLDWVVVLTRTRRAALAEVAPRFWRPRADAEAIHRSYLGSLISDTGTVALRTDHGYLLAEHQGPVWTVDDMAVSSDDMWPSDGVALLREAQRRCGRLRFVVPAAEEARLAAAGAVGLEPVEAWWHRDVPADPDAPETGAGHPAVRVADAEGRLVTAPPIYDPGGPVLLVTSAGSAHGLALIEAEAARRGARVAVVSHRPDDTASAQLLTAAGYRLTTLFCEPARG